MIKCYDISCATLYVTCRFFMWDWKTNHANKGYFKFCVDVAICLLPWQRKRVPWVNLLHGFLQMLRFCPCYPIFPSIRFVVLFIGMLFLVTVPHNFDMGFALGWLEWKVEYMWTESMRIVWNIITTYEPSFSCSQFLRCSSIIKKTVEKSCYVPVKIAETYFSK